MYISEYVVVNTFVGGCQPQNKLMRLRTFKNHELYQGVAPPGLTYHTYRWRVKKGEGKAKHKRDTTLCICVYV